MKEKGGSKSDVQDSKKRNDQDFQAQLQYQQQQIMQQQSPVRYDQDDLKCTILLMIAGNVGNYFLDDLPEARREDFVVYQQKSGRSGPRML